MRSTQPGLRHCSRNYMDGCEWSAAVTGFEIDAGYDGYSLSVNGKYYPNPADDGMIGYKNKCGKRIH